MRKLLIVLSFLAGLPAVQTMADTVSGTAAYRERIALQPGAVFEAKLLDVSLADAPAVEIGSVRMDDPAGPPFAFEIPYERDQIAENRSYTVRAELRLGDRLLFTTDTAHPVLTRGAPETVDIVMVKVSGVAAPIPAHGLVLPATFRGDLPCADCEAIRHHLDLWEDQVFHLRREWIGGAGPLVDDMLGRWHIDPARNAIVLQSSAEAPLVFQITGPDSLRQTDRDGQPIVSDLPYDLTSGALDPVDISAPMIGEFVYFADSALFTECTTGRGYPVVQDSDYLALERAYLEARAEPMAPLVATIEGTITPREGMEGGVRQMIVVDRFSNVWPGLGCERARADAGLTNTYWRIDRLEGAVVAPQADTREPHVLLRSDENAFAATVGCNQILGGFVADGPSLSFMPGPMTMMACPPPLDALERQLVDVLARVAGARIVGPTLELFDADGSALAQLEAVYLP